MDDNWKLEHDLFIELFLHGIACIKANESGYRLISNDELFKTPSDINKEKTTHKT